MHSSFAACSRSICWKLRNVTSKTSTWPKNEKEEKNDYIHASKNEKRHTYQCFTRVEKQKESDQSAIFFHTPKNGKLYIRRVFTLVQKWETGNLPVFSTRRITENCRSTEITRVDKRETVGPPIFHELKHGKRSICRFLPRAEKLETVNPPKLHALETGNCQSADFMWGPQTLENANNRFKMSACKVYHSVRKFKDRLGVKRYQVVPKRSLRFRTKLVSVS